MSQQHSTSTSTDGSQPADRSSPDAQQDRAGLGSVFKCEHCSTAMPARCSSGESMGACTRMCPCSCQQPEYDMRLKTSKKQVEGTVSTDDSGRWYRTCPVVWRLTYTCRSLVVLGDSRRTETSLKQGSNGSNDDIARCHPR